ncbi:MAG: hypothetical protein Kow0063_26960 [Anaerolineae bacterium]
MAPNQTSLGLANQAVILTVRKVIASQTATRTTTAPSQTSLAPANQVVTLTVRKVIASQTATRTTTAPSQTSLAPANQVVTLTVRKAAVALEATRINTSRPLVILDQNQERVPAAPQTIASHRATKTTMVVVSSPLKIMTTEAVVTIVITVKEGRMAATIATVEMGMGAARAAKRE